MKPKRAEILRCVQACDLVNEKSRDPIEQSSAAILANALRWVVQDTDWPSPASQITPKAKLLRKKLRGSSDA